MRKIRAAILLLMLANNAVGQIANGSTAPDFTFTDINGITQNLYSYLNAGKYVAIDVSTTWCGPCWAYHNMHVMDSLYTLYDNGGNHTWKVLFIEGDGGTTLADVQGTGTSTQGNWAAGALYSISNPPSGAALNDFITNYAIGVWPTFFLICPNKKVYQDTLNAGGSKPLVKTWEYVVSTKCSAAGLDNLQDADPVTLFPNPAKEETSIYFGLNSPAGISITVTNIMGQVISAKNFGLLPGGDQILKYDISGWQTGMYVFTISDSNGRSVRKKISVQ